METSVTYYVIDFQTRVIQMVMCDKLNLEKCNFLNFKILCLLLEFSTSFFSAVAA